MIKKLNGNSTILGICIALGLAIIGFSIALSIKYFRDFGRYVEVKGSAEQVVKANQGSWQIGFTASGNDLKSIYTSINSQQQIVISFLEKQGFSGSSITKQPVSIYDNHSSGYSNNNAAHYTANAGISITSSDVDKLASSVQLTNQLVESGVIINNNGVNYQYTDLNKIKASILDQALSNAKVSAEQFAKNSKSELGKIRSASQGVVTITSTDPSLSDSATIDKKVRVVTTVKFFLK